MEKQVQRSNSILIRKALLVFIALVLSAASQAQGKKYKQKIVIDTVAFGDNSRHWYGIWDKGNIINPLPGRPRYKATEITKVADNIILYQKDNGGWPKNYDVMAVLTSKQKDSLKKAKGILNTTFDNGTTYTHIACLADVYSATRIKRYKDAALKGLDFVLSAQYDNGGWPQHYPLESGYSRHITYNDGVFAGIIQLLKDISDGRPAYSFIDNSRRAKLKKAYEKGIDCIIKTQINEDGKRTAWCQQHDEVTLQPVWARAFEPPCISNGESGDVVLFLMSIRNPGKEVVDAVQSAVSWFQESKIYYTRVKVVPAPLLKTDFRMSATDRVVVTDSAAPPIWTRYYELKTYRPMFCNRDGKIVYSLAEVDRERRDGYAWYTYNPQKVLNAYPAWQKKWAPGKNVLQQ